MKQLKTMAYGLFSIEQNEIYYSESLKYVTADDLVLNDVTYFDKSQLVVNDVDKFRYDEMDKIIKSCPNGRSVGNDGVLYEDYKRL